MTILDALAALGTTFRGQGVNHEGEAFAGELKIQPLVGRNALLLHYKATLPDGSLAHEESTLLGRGPDGRMTLWPVMSELEVVLPHYETGHVSVANEAQVACVVFASGPRTDQSIFREEITLELKPNGELLYAHAWGLPGGSFEDRSHCCMAPIEA